MCALGGDADGVGGGGGGVVGLVAFVAREGAVVVEGSVTVWEGWKVSWVCSGLIHQGF